MWPQVHNIVVSLQNHRVESTVMPAHFPITIGQDFAGQAASTRKRAQWKEDAKPPGFAPLIEMWNSAVLID
jgi:hypothetical protein